MSTCKPVHPAVHADGIVNDDIREASISCETADRRDVKKVTVGSPKSSLAENSRSTIHLLSNLMMSSYPCPVDRKAMGFLMAWAMDSAAPPLASASILVRMTASMPTALSKATRLLDGVVAGERVADEDDQVRA